MNHCQSSWKTPLLIFAFFSLAQAKEPQTRPRESVRVDLGPFHFPLNDERIQKKLLDTDNSITAWGIIFDDTVDFWNQNWNNDSLLEPPSVEEEEAIFRVYATNATVNMTDFESVLDRANASYQKTLADWKGNATNLYLQEGTDLSDKFMAEALERYFFLDYATLAAWAGVGRSVECADRISSVLKDMDEWEKAGMQAATTLMALLPTFLAFGNLFVPRSSEAFATSWLVGMGAALFSLGLPTKSLSCVCRKKVLSLLSFDKESLNTISDLGSRDPRVVPEEKELHKLQQWTQADPPYKYMQEFGRIRRAVDQYRDRWHWWHVPAVLIAACQGLIFGLAIQPLLKAGGIPRFIYACAGMNWTGLYLWVSATANAVFRLCLWQMCDHEVVNIKYYRLIKSSELIKVSVYHLSEAARSSLATLITSTNPTLITTETQLPPLYPPVVSRLHTTFGTFLHRLITSFTPLPAEHPHRRPFKLDTSELLASVKLFFRNISSTLTSGFAPTSAAPRYRPLVVLVHLSTNGRPQLRTLLTGFCEAALLLALTIFFASQWGGNLFVTSIALALLLVFVTLGRALAIVYVWLSARTWGLHTINCDEQAEILGVMRILCSMQKVMVTVNGAHYVDGHRLDYMEDFRDWKRKYDRGEYDDKPQKKAQISRQEPEKEPMMHVSNSPEPKADGKDEEQKSVASMV